MNFRLAQVALQLTTYAHRGRPLKHQGEHRRPSFHSRRMACMLLG